VVDRTTEILGTVDRLASEWDKWADDPMTPAIEEDSPLEDAIQVCVQTCDSGDVPSQCRELVDAVSRFALEHDKYRDGDFDPQTMSPWRKHAVAYSGILRARAGAAGPQKTIVESVRLLRDQKVSDRQIAVIYGSRAPGKWVGPFFGPNEQVLSHLISQEAENPGSVITADFIHPKDIAAQQLAEKNLSARLNRLQRQADEDKPRTFTDSDVLAYLNEGAFAHQAARVYKLRIEEIHRIARDGGLTLPGSSDYLTQPDPTNGKANFTSNDEKTTLEAHRDEVRKTVIRLSESGVSVPEIRKTIAKQYRNAMTIESVVAIIREAKDGQTSPDGQAASAMTA
jgi:hypothetical protein